MSSPRTPGSAYVPKGAARMPNWDQAMGDVADSVEQLEQRLKAGSAAESPRKGPAARPQSSPRKMQTKADLAVKAGMDPRQAERMVALATAEERAYALQHEYNVLSFAAEEKQQKLERLAETVRFLSMGPAAVPMSPPASSRKASPPRDGGGGESKSGSPGGRSASPAAAAATAGGEAGASASPHDSSARDETLSQLLGDHHPTVRLEHDRRDVEARL